MKWQKNCHWRATPIPSHILLYTAHSHKDTKEQRNLYGRCIICVNRELSGTQLPFLFPFSVRPGLHIRATQKCQSLIGPGHKQKIGKERKEVKVTAAQRLTLTRLCDNKYLFFPISVRCHTICELTLSHTWQFIYESILGWAWIYKRKLLSHPSHWLWTVKWQ